MGLSAMVVSIVKLSDVDFPSRSSSSWETSAWFSPSWDSPTWTLRCELLHRGTLRQCILIHDTLGNGLSGLVFSLVGLSDMVVSIVELPTMDSPSRSSPLWVTLTWSSPSWGLLRHHREHLPRRSEPGPITIAATACTAIAIIAIVVISNGIISIAITVIAQLSGMILCSA